MPLGIGLLNCYNRSGPLMEAINQLSSNSDDWVLGLTEPSLRRSDELITNCSLIFQSTSYGKAAILTTSPQWELLWCPDDTDLIVIRRTDGIRDLIVSCVYISPTRDLKTTRIKEIARKYHEFFRKHPTSHHILMGDFNARHPLWSFKQQNEMGNIIGNCLLHLRMESAIQPNERSWTRWDTIHDSYSWIDAVMITTKLRKYIKERRILDIHGSDHRMIRIIISESWTEKRINYPKLNKYAKECDLSFLNILPSTSKEADDGLIRLTEQLQMAQSVSTGLIRPRNTFRPPARLTKISRQATRRAKKFLINRKTSPSRIPSLARICINSIDMYNIKKIPQIIKRIRTTAKRKMLIDIERRKGPWTMIKRVIGKYSVKTMKQYMNHKYSRRDIPSPSNEFIKSYRHPLITISPNRTLEVVLDSVNKIHNNEMDKIIKAVTAKQCAFDTNSSCVPLKYFLKHHQQKIVRYICYCLSCNHIPTFIKKAKTKLIPKSDPNKCRPLSILHPLYRLIDAVIYHILESQINHSFLQFQFAFIKSRSPIDLHLKLKDIYQTLLKDNLPLIIISIDLTDAFEQISFSAIRCGLKNMRIGEQLIRIIINHIINRQSFINSFQGRIWKTHQSGTPQGGFLSPLLFIIGLSNLWHLNDYPFRILAYADDIYIIAQTENTSNPWFDVNKRLYELNSLLSAMNLAPNTDKSKFCLVHSPGQELKKTKITIMLGNKPITQQNSINVLGIEIKPGENNCERLTNSKNTASDKISELQSAIIPLAPRIQGMRLKHGKIMLEALFMGLMNYYCQLQRIWQSYDSFLQQCEECMEKCGHIIKTIWGLKLTFSNIMAYYIVFHTHLAVRMENLLVKYITRKESISKYEINCLDRHVFDPYGIRILEMNYTPTPRYIRTTTSPHQIHTLALLNYHIKRIKFDLWIKVNFAGSNEKQESQMFRYWCHGNSYLDILVNCITRFIATSTLFRECNEITIEASKILIIRLRSLKMTSQLSQLFTCTKLNLQSAPRPYNMVKITDRDLITIPRDVLRFSPQYWQLFDIYSHLYEAQKHENNIILSSLHFSRFNAFKDLDKIWRLDLINICLLGGAWHKYDQVKNCPSCGHDISTRQLLFGCCAHFENGSVKGRQIDVQNIVMLTSNITFLRGVFTHFRRNLKNIPTFSPTTP